jgi:ParB/RepB/Spo0J family partition protein
VPSTRSRTVVTLADMDRVARERPPIDDRSTQNLPVNAIHPSPRNPRTDFGSLDELAASLQTHGLLQPIVVRRDGEGYEIIAGHRRHAAATQLGWPSIACVVRDAEPDEAFVLTLVENLQRDDLSPKEEAAGLEALLRERGWSTRQVAAAVKRSPKFVSNRLRVFDDPILAPYVLRNEVTVSMAEETLVLPRKERQELIEAAATAHWNRADMRRAVTQALKPHLGRRPHGLTAQLRNLRRVLQRMQPQDYTAQDRAELVKIIEIAQWDARRYARRATSATGPVFPTIGETGRAFIPGEDDVPSGGVVLLEKEGGGNANGEDHRD